LQIIEIERLLGIDAYCSKSEGFGGIIRESVDDFVVEEVLVDCSKASVNGDVPDRVLGCSIKKQRFLLCVMVKRNWDTFIAIKNIAKFLGIDQTRVQFAGIKDAKAVTAQHITLENILIEDVRKIDIKEISIFPIGYVRNMLSLFYLLGNNFTITIKSINGSEQTVKDNITKTINELESLGGIANFFGHQRFGTTRPITHLVGKAIIQGDFEQAAMLFLAKPSVYEHPVSRQARQELESTRNFKQAQENFPKQLRFERIMLNYLADNHGDFVGAFQCLPIKLQALFVQAHQSYLFNRFLSERMKHDLPLNEIFEGDYVVGVERSGLPLTSVTKVAKTEDLSEINSQVKAGRLRLALPIFGVKQKLSQGIMGQIENEVLEQEGIEMTHLPLNVLSQTGGKGGMRSAITPIRDFKLQKISGSDTGDGVQATVSFMLLRGSYATVVLRELMKPSDLISAGF
jgi:tRNA pseudouridine13 synthase